MTASVEHGIAPPRLLPRSARIVASVLGTYVVAGGLASFLGWALDVPRLTDWIGSGISIQPNTCLAAIAAGAGVVFLALGHGVAARVAGALVALIGLTVPFQFLTEIDLGVDGLLLFGRPWGNDLTIVPGRMGPPGATSWTLVGSGLLLASLRGRPALRLVASAFGLVAAGLSTLSIVGYLYGANRLYTIPTLTVIALQTATFVAAASTGLVLSVPERGLARLVSEDGPARTLFVRALPALIGLPIVLGFVRVLGERAGLYDAAFGSSLRTMVEISLFLVLLAWTGAALNRHSERRRESDETLRTSQKRFLDSLERLSDGFVTLDRDWRYTFANAQAERLLGKPRSELLGERVWDVFPEATEGPARELRRAVAAGESVEFERYEAASSRWFSNKASPTADGGMTITFSDITAQRIAEQALHVNREQLEAELTDTSLLQRLSGELIGDAPPERLDDLIVGAAVSIMRSDFSSLQTLVHERGEAELRLVAHRGFDAAAAEKWARVKTDTGCTCGEALRRGRRVVVPDVRTCDFVDPVAVLPEYERTGLRAIQSTPLVSRGGKIIGMISTHWRAPHEPPERDLRQFDILARQAADLMERRAAEASLREREDALNEAQRVARVGSWQWDPANDASVASDEFHRLFGLPAGGPVPRLAEQADVMYPRESFAKLDAAVRRAIDGGEGFSLDLEALRGGVDRFWVTIRGEAVRDSSGAVAFLRGTVQDVSERLTAESDRRRQERLLRSVTQNARVGLVIVSAEHRYLYANPSFAEVLGLAAIDLVGRHVRDDLGGAYDEQVRPHVERAFEGARVEHELALPPLGDGRAERYFAVTYEPQQDEIGRVTNVVVTVTDVTQRREIEAAREKIIERESAARADAERAVRMKDEFLATLSHELRTPLNAILGWLHILRKDLENPERLRQGVEVLERNARAQAQLIADLLDMSRITSGKMVLEAGPVDVADVVRAALQSMRPAAEAKGVALDLEIRGTPDVVHGDPARLQQVAWNLLSNAVKFTSRGGRVEAAVERREMAVAIVVRDTGEGIDPAFLPFLFERFRQADSSAARRHGGLGIGLALVKQLVELHGGCISVESEGKDRGSTFVVEIPVRSPSIGDLGPALGAGDGAGAAAGLDAAGLPSLAGLDVLVVDDDADALEMARRVLEEREAVVVTAGDFAAALESLSQRRFHVIVSDIGMPERDGYELLAEARRRGVTAPALAVTAYARDEDRDEALRAGYQRHVSKPVAAADLVRSVRSLADAPPAS